MKIYINITTPTVIRAEIYVSFCIFTRKNSLTETAPCHRRCFKYILRRQQILFILSTGERKFVLTTGKSACIRPQLVHSVCMNIGQPKKADFSCFFQLIQLAQYIFNRCLPVPIMNCVNIHIVRIQSAKTAFQCFADVFRRIIVESLSVPCTNAKLRFNNSSLAVRTKPFGKSTL